MKKTSIIFAIISTIVGLIGVVTFTIYFVLHLSTLGKLILQASTGESTSGNMGFQIFIVIMFLVLTIYSVFVAITGLLTRRVIENNVLDKIGKFGVLSIIFFNPVGGVFTIVYDKHLQEELARTAPKGKRKEATK